MNYASQKFGWYSRTQHILNTSSCKVYKDTDGDPVAVTLVTNSCITPYINGYNDYIFAGPVVECIQPEPTFVPHEWYPTKPSIDNDPCYADTMTKWLEDQVKADLANTITNYNKDDKNTFNAKPQHIKANPPLQEEENELAKTHVSKEKLKKLIEEFKRYAKDRQNRAFLGSEVNKNKDLGRADAYEVAAIRLYTITEGWDL